MTKETSRIIKAIRSVPKGKASCYRDIALAAGSRGYLAELTRTQIGNFYLKDAFNPAEYRDVNTADTAQALINAIRPINEKIFESLELPYRYAEKTQAEAIFHGKNLENPPLDKLIADLPNASAAGIFAENGKLAAILEQKTGKWHYGHVFT